MRDDVKNTALSEVHQTEKEERESGCERLGPSENQARWKIGLK